MPTYAFKTARRPMAPRRFEFTGSHLCCEMENEITVRNKTAVAPQPLKFPSKAQFKKQTTRDPDYACNPGLFVVCA